MGKEHDNRSIFLNACRAPSHRERQPFSRSLARDPQQIKHHPNFAQTLPLMTHNLCNVLLRVEKPCPLFFVCPSVHAFFTTSLGSFHITSQFLLLRLLLTTKISEPSWRSFRCKSTAGISIWETCRLSSPTSFACHCRCVEGAPGYHFIVHFVPH